MDTDTEDDLNELIDAYLLNQEINQALNGDNQHETLPDKSNADIDTVASVSGHCSNFNCTLPTLPSDEIHS